MTDHVAHQFDTAEQQHDAATLGMWAFLATEVMFFGGLFVTYAVYRRAYGPAFGEASRLLDLRLGALNTAVLLASSLTMALAVHGAQLGRRRVSAVFLLLTLLLGATFLGVKAVEYHHKWVDHLVPGARFRLAGGHGEAGSQLFFSLYFGMTGLHALHMIVGVGVLATLLALTLRRRGVGETAVEMSGLYWHFVDIVWILLFPLLYLVERHR